MIIQKQDCKMEIDLEKTKEYYQIHSLCDCPCCRNFYAQAKSVLPLLDGFLSELGIDITRPDELGSVELEEKIQYIFASYTVCGRILEYDKYEIDLWNNELFLNIVIGDSYIPNEQKEDHFVVTVYNINLPWILDEPFPETIPTRNRFGDKIKKLFSKNK